MVHFYTKMTQSLLSKPMKKQEQPIAAEPKNLPVINPNAAGIDIGADRHWVSVPVSRDNESVRSFACFTADLYAFV
jgi:transposase